jgi:hypothetical protein
MDGSTLEAAYRALGAAINGLVAEDIQDVDEYSSAPWILAYLILCDEKYVETAATVLEARSTAFDNRAALTTNLAGSMVATHTWGQLADRALATAARLIELLRQIPESYGDLQIRVRLYNRAQQPLFDEWLSWRNLIKLHAEQQVPEYTSKLTALENTLAR